MPYKNPKNCMYQGCPNLVKQGRYCYLHKRKDKNLYSSKEWRRTRAEVLEENPYCKCGAIATEVHHNRWGELETYCKSCHSKITRVQVSR